MQVRHTLSILSKQAEKYRALVEAARLPDLRIESTPTAEVDIVFGEPDRIKGALDSLPALKWVQATWAGIEPLLDPAARRDYILTNARGVFGRLMSEYVFAYLLAHERKLFARFEAQQARRWDNSLTGTLHGKTIGLLGVGSIGSELARTAGFFDMRVRGYTRESENCANVDAYYHGTELLEFAKGLDYLVSILPNTEETYKIVDAALFAALPPNALFINAGRGSTVDESALIDALNRNKIAGAVLDVYEQEPLPAGHRFWTTKNLQMTFHTSAPSLPQDITKLFIENYLLFAEGKPLKHRVDFERGY